MAMEPLLEFLQQLQNLKVRQLQFQQVQLEQVTLFLGEILLKMALEQCINKVILICQIQMLLYMLNEDYSHIQLHLMQIMELVPLIRKQKCMVKQLIYLQQLRLEMVILSLDEILRQMAQGKIILLLGHSI